MVFSPVTGNGHTKTFGPALVAGVRDWQGLGVGAHLIVEGLKACEKVGNEMVVVLGHPEYYSRFGFLPSVHFGIKTEYDVPPEYFMVKDLQDGALQRTTGTLQSHQVFNEP